MTTKVNIGEAKAQLSRLVAAALRGEDVVVARNGVPKVRLVPIPEAIVLDREARAAKRRAAIGFLREKYAHLPPEVFDVPPSMTDEELEERFKRKFGE